MKQSNKDSSSKVRMYIGLAAVIVAIGIGGYFWRTGNRLQKSPAPLIKLSIAIPNSTAATPIIIAHKKIFFEGEGLDVTLQRHTSGKAATVSLLEGNANLATMGDIPVMYAVMRGKQLKIIATINFSEKDLSIVARRDKGIETLSDLKGKKIGVTPGTGGEFFMDALLNANGIGRDEVEVVKGKPREIVNALAKGRVDAISIWQPHGIRAQEMLGDKAIIFLGKGIHRGTFNLAGKADFVRKNPETIKKILRALVQAENFIGKNQDKSMEIIGTFFKVDSGQLRKTWDRYNFEVSLKQSLLLTLEDESRWAIRNKFVDKKSVPNYLNIIYVEGLHAVKPEAVTIIR